MKIGIITYDHPHRKTEDLMSRFIMDKWTDITLICIPWVDKKPHKTTIHHRPLEPLYGLWPEVIANNWNYKCIKCEVEKLAEIFEEQKFYRILIAGAGILPNDVIKYKIINSHPGYLPLVRGLDALKRAILYRLPIGVTTHYITEEVDLGPIIERRLVPIYKTDSFYEIAMRQYEMEIKMLYESVFERTYDEWADSYPTNKRFTPQMDELLESMLTNDCEDWMEYYGIY